MPAFTIEVDMDKGWEIVYETNNQQNAFERFSHEMNLSVQGDLYNCRLTTDWQNQESEFDGR